MTTCPSRGPMFGDHRPTCELLLDHEEPHGAEVDGVWIQWDRTVDPELMIVPVGATREELDELTDLIKARTIHARGRCEVIAREILAAGFRKIPEGGTVMVPAPEDDIDW